MELNKALKKVMDIEKAIRSAYMKDVDSIVTKIFGECDVCDKETKAPIKKDELLKRVYMELEREQNCCAITKSNTKCTRKSQPHSQYCKSHMFYNIDAKMTKASVVEEEVFIVEMDYSSEIDGKTKENMHLKFIEDAFYYIDDKFIYDKSDLSLVGYIEKTCEKSEYILTNNPFVLKTLTS
jgi:hypothetical protein